MARRQAQKRGGGLHISSLDAGLGGLAGVFTIPPAQAAPGLVEEEIAMTPFLTTPGRRCSAVAAWLLGLACLQPASASTWDDAQDAFLHHADAAGLRLLARAAGEGDARAMQAWGLALLHGPRLFPGLLQADAKRAAAWFDRLAGHCGVERPGAVEPTCLAMAGGVPHAQALARAPAR
jgi:hypothetical protein